nr:gustatory receptor 24.2 [Papilio memnon]
MKIKQQSAVDSVSACIVQCMRSLLCIEYIYGVFRCRLSGRSSEGIGLRMKITSVAVTSIWLTIFSLGVITYMGNIFNDGTALIECMSWLLSGAQYTITIILSIFWQTKKNQRVIELFAGIDIGLHAGINKNFYSMSLFQCKKLLFTYVVFCFILIVICIYYYIYNQVIGNIAFLFIYAETKIEIIVFCQFLFMIKQRLFLIRDYLSKITFDGKRRMYVQNSETYVDVNFIGHISSNNFRIRDLISLYCKIGKLCNIINDIFDCLMLTTLASAFLIILSNIYISLLYVKLNHNLLVSLPILFSILFELFFVILFAYYCGNVTVARNEVKYSLHEITKNNDLPLSMRTQAEVFLDLIKVWPMSFYVFEMFEVDFKLVLKFISISTTYVIVVIQISHLI